MPTYETSRDRQYRENAEREAEILRQARDIERRQRQDRESNDAWERHNASRRARSWGGR